MQNQKHFENWIRYGSVQYAFNLYEQYIGKSIFIQVVLLILAKFNIKYLKKSECVLGTYYITVMVKRL